MKKLFGSKTFILVLGGICVLALIFLAAAVSGLNLKPGTPFAYAAENQSTDPGEMPDLNPLLCFVPVVLVVVVIFFLLPKDQRKKYLWTLACLALFGIILFIIISRMSLGTAVPVPTPGAGSAITPIAEDTPTPAPTVLPVQYVEPTVSPWLSYVIALVVLLAGGGVWFWLAFRKRKEEPPLDELAGIARETMQDLEAGKDWGDTVLNCYYRMTTAVEKWRYIRRHSGMTPAEFAVHLASTGLPRAAVNGLTAIFERVRYGGRKSNSEDIRQAMDCLAAILAYCEENNR
jgi:hypothetical protein